MVWAGNITPYHPWDERYIYLHEYHKFKLHVGKYIPYMDPYGNDHCHCIFWYTVCGVCFLREYLSACFFESLVHEGKTTWESRSSFGRVSYQPLIDSIAEKLPKHKRKGSFSNHFSGMKLNFWVYNLIFFVLDLNLENSEKSTLR